MNSLLLHNKGNNISSFIENIREDLRRDHMIITKIKNKQKEILLLLLRFRAITTKQTQTLLHHKNHRRINIWLTDLVDKNYIGKIKEERSPGNNMPAIYYLEKDGLIFLKDQPAIEKSNLNKMRDEREKKSDFFTKCLFIVDIYIYLLSQSKNDSYILKFYAPNDFSKKAKIRELMPSFAYVKEKDGKREQFTCEFIHTKMPEYPLQRRIDSYLEYFSDEERKSPMHIIFICQNDKKYKQAKKYIAETYDENINNLYIQVVTYDEARKEYIYKNN